MKEADKISENHTFILITDPISEYYLGFGISVLNDFFNIPFPQDYKMISDKVDENDYLRKTIYSGTVEFFN